jgi:hypothetical protein
MGVVNQGLMDIENSRQQQKHDPTKTVELRAMADIVEKSSTKASALTVTTPEVRDLVGRYAKMTKDVATEARSAADAHEKGDLVKLAEAQTKLNVALKQEDPLIDDLNKLCK